MALNNMVVDEQGDGICVMFPQYTDVRVLSANTNESHTVPTGAFFVDISSSAIVYIRAGGTAAIASADVTDGTGSFQVNASEGLRRYNLSGVTSIGLIAPATTTVTMTFYRA